MTFYGLHLWDWILIVVYFVTIMWIGKATSHSIHKQSDFFLGGRKLGPVLQFFLNFGNATDANGAVRTSSVVYSQGVGGVWLMMQLLFITPYYWFMNAWFRRSRLTTVADLFADRFGCRSLAVLYAVCNIFFTTVAIGGSYLVAYKITEILVVKPVEIYTVEEKRQVADYHEYVQLSKAYKSGTLPAAEAGRYEDLRALYDRGEIKSYISYIKPVPLYLAFAFVVGAYVMLGGLTAAAISDAIQGVLIVIFSVILIPFGLMQLGGLGAMHAKIPDRMVELFGSGGASEFAWYSILAILLVTLIQAHGNSVNMGISGSARTETAASFGAVSGGFMKRWMTIAWCFCGLMAFALFGEGLSDPDVVWGSLSRTLLGPGFLGLMLVGFIAADMAHTSAQCLTLSALFVRNIYLVIFPNRSEKEGLLLGKLIVAASLIAGIGIALFFKDIISFAKMSLTLNVAFGAAILVMFKWKRVTRTAVLIAVPVSLFVIVAVPFLVPAIPALRNHPALHARTIEQSHVVTRHATEDDISLGLAAVVGDEFQAPAVIPAKPIFFERLILIDPANPEAGRRGEGRFNFELYLLSLCGLDLTKFLPAQLFTFYYVFVALLPFVLLFGISLLTRERDPARAEAFYTKMRTSVVPDPEEDEANLRRNLANPSLTLPRKLFPNTSWELLRWSKIDIIAFTGCCLFALFILGVFLGILHLGRF